MNKVLEKIKVFFFSLIEVKLFLIILHVNKTIFIQREK